MVVWKARQNLQLLEKRKKNVPIEGIALVDDDINYNSRRNNMDFGTCFVVVLVGILFVIAWIEDQSNKSKWK
jgi:hypothetical protein